MQKKYKSILLFTKIHKDNDLFVKLLTDTNELITGIVYGGLSKKKRNIFQVGYFLNIDVSFIANRPPSISAELTNPLISSFINDKYKLSCLLSIMCILNLSIIEGQKINNIFNITDEFIKLIISKKKWIGGYCIFLFNLLEIIGYQIDYKKNKDFKYYDLDLLEFTNNKTYNSIIFPFNLLENNEIPKLYYNQIFNVFIIFETIFFKNHLTNFNQYLPNQYQLFKEIINDYLNIK